MTARELDGRDAAEAHIELLTGSRDTVMDFRLIHDSDKTHRVRKFHGVLGKLWTQFEAAQVQGYGVFLVVNEGGNKDGEICTIRALFVDADNTHLPSKWHMRPDFIVQRDATHWHAYWRVFFLPVLEFRGAQKRLAAHYGTDPSVCNPSRVMRLAGTLHQKGAAQ